MAKSHWKTLLAAAGCAALSTQISVASEFDDKVKKLAEGALSQVVKEQLVIDSIKEQNQAHADLSQSDIDALDQQWRAETAGSAGSLISDTLGKPLSDYLYGVLEESGGLYSEIFIMDNRGLNVGQSGVTSDYWQGDESKWQDTFSVGPDAVHASEIEFDESSQTYQMQISIAISDPASGQVIGAATFGVNADSLQYASVDEL